MLSLAEVADLLERAVDLNARSRYESLSALLEPVPLAELITELELVYLLAHARLRMGHPQRALWLLQLIEKQSGRRGHDRLLRRTLNLKGAILVERGELMAAERLFETVTRYGSQSGDQRIVADATMNMGVLAWIRCEWIKAIAAFNRARPILEAHGRMYTLAGCHQNLAMTYRELGDLREADRHIRTALQYYHRAGEGERAREISICGIERALIATEMGDMVFAEASARLALGTLRQFDSPHTEGEAQRVLGKVLLARGKRDEARECFVRALICARRAKVVLLQAEACEELAIYHTLESSPLRAARWSNRSVVRYNAIGAAARAARVHPLMGRADDVA